jgi:hypothetical protein
MSCCAFDLRPRTHPDARPHQLRSHPAELGKPAVRKNIKTLSDGDEATAAVMLSQGCQWRPKQVEQI